LSNCCQDFALHSKKVSFIERKMAVTPVEILGYIASAVVAVSLTQASVLKLRLLNLAGAVLFTVYGVLLAQPPLIGVNILIIGINIYYLWQMFNQKTYFRLLEVDRNSSYLRQFFEFHQKDMAKFFPQFEYHEERAKMVYLILRDMLPVGIFITEQDAAGRAVVRLDYVIAGYRDLKAGQFLYQELDQRLPAQGVTTLYSVPGSEHHSNYLTRMGFIPQGEGERIKLYAREMGNR
jgi:hypothetical protein